MQYYPIIMFSILGVLLPALFYVHFTRRWLIENKLISIIGNSTEPPQKIAACLEYGGVYPFVMLSQLVACFLYSSGSSDGNIYYFGVSKNNTENYKPGIYGLGYPVSRMTDPYSKHKTLLEWNAIGELNIELNIPKGFSIVEINSTHIVALYKLPSLFGYGRLEYLVEELTKYYKT